MTRTMTHDRLWPLFGDRRNVGAYEQPFSGVGLEYEPLGAPGVDTDITLHEVGYWPTNYDWNYPSVYSPFWRVYYDFQPGHVVRFGANETSLGPQNIVVIPDHQRFDCIGTPPVPKLWIHFSCRRRVGLDATMPIQIPVDRVTRAMFEEFPSLFLHRTSAQRPAVRRLGFALLVYLLDDPRIPRHEHLPAGVVQAVQQINQRPSHPWRNPELAAIASLSTEGFIRLFKRCIGETPIRYVQQVRVREACRLLSDTEKTIDTIAVQTGFPDRFYFSRVFKQHTNCSPAAYRRKCTSAARLAAFK